MNKNRNKYYNVVLNNVLILLKFKKKTTKEA